MGRTYNVHGESETLILGGRGESEGKRPLGRHRRRWEDIKIGLKEVEFQGV
jgi:hypothetical protein